MSRVSLPGLAALAAALCACAGPRLKPPADLVLRGGSVRAAPGEAEWRAASAPASALAVRGGRIAFVGGDAEAAAWIGPGTRVVELKGAAVLPGFQDAHVHPVSGGVELGECDLNGRKSAAELLAAVTGYVAAHPDAPWIRGGGWDLTLFADANPDKELLDGAVSDRPVYLSAADGHSAWVNSRALQLAGISAATRDPEGGRIERGPGGEPSGTLREAALGLVESKLPPRTAAERLAGLRRALRLAASLGLTSLQEAAADAEDLDAYLELERTGELTARVSVALEADLSRGLEQLRGLDILRRRARGPLVRASTVKIFMDGVLEARTAALLAPYRDRGGLGSANLDPGRLDPLVVALDAAGFQVHIHAIGDRAARLALDAFAAARRANGKSRNRHHIAHLELVDPADLPRFRELGVTATVQPLWAQRDDYISRLTEPGLGPERSGRLYPIGGLLRAGARLACGSDWSVSSMSPLEGMQVGVTRRALEEAGGAGGSGMARGAPWLPEQAVLAEDMLDCYTRGGAYVNFLDRVAGRIAPGLAADLVVLDRDPLRVAPSEIGRTRVLWTLLEGRETYRAPDFAAGR